jgi:hypothetical protein
VDVQADHLRLGALGHETPLEELAEEVVISEADLVETVGE